MILVLKRLSNAWIVMITMEENSLRCKKTIVKKLQIVNILLGNRHYFPYGRYGDRLVFITRTCHPNGHKFNKAWMRLVYVTRVDFSGIKTETKTKRERKWRRLFMRLKKNNGPTISAYPGTNETRCFYDKHYSTTCPNEIEKRLREENF